MAEGDITFYNKYKESVVAGTVDWDADTIRVMLLDDNYTPNIDTHEFIDDVSADEIVASGYTAEGEALASKTNVVDTGNDRTDVDAADVTWSSLATATIGFAVIHQDTGTPGTSVLICYMEISTNSNGGDYTLQWNATGIFTLT